MSQMRDEMRDPRPSLEHLVEEEDLGIEILHPGGIEITRELAGLCGIANGTTVLDVASGTGESACFLADSLGARVTGVDLSDALVERAARKAAERRIDVDFRKADALALPFAADSFDVVLSECALCLLDKSKAIAEMVRAAKPGGRIGMHDICWHTRTPERTKRRLAALEDERPETLDGWRQLFEQAGLVDVQALERSRVLPTWTRSIKRSLGVSGQLRIFLKVARRWGLSGLASVLESERIFRSPHLGYGLVVGTKPTTGA